MHAPTSLRRRSVHRAKFYGVDLKRVPPKSRPAARRQAAIYLRRWNLARVRPARTPPSTFLFLPIHLSNSPGLATPSLDAPESLRSSCHRPKSVTNHRESEELRRRAFPPSGGAPCIRYICSTAGYCQPGILEFFIRSSSTTARAVHRCLRRRILPAIADLQPLIPAKIRAAAL
jgi:hypothetical protein